KPAVPPQRDVPAQWTVARPDRLKPPSKPVAEPQPPVDAEPARPTRAERRRAAEADGDTGEPGDYAATRSSDLNRIAAFLRSTQDIPTDTPKRRAAPQQAPPPTPPPAEEKTSELPTVISEEPPDKSEQVLNAVRQIPGVTGARLADSDSTLSLEIAEDADTNLVSRSVVDLLDSRLGLAAQPVSPAVGTVDTEPKRERSFALPPGSRAVLERTQIITSGFESTVEVGLTVNGARAVGRSTGPAVDWHILRAAADATVDAIGVLLGRSARVVVEHASIETAGPGRVAVVTVLLLTEEGSERLAGAAPVDGDRRQAIVHATLQALNRRLETMLLS
ncbi:MAG TPA: hypothetical protein VE172_15830, partial [Stackebrandtia sp.]